MDYKIMNSAVVKGEISIGKGSIISYGTVVESEDNSVKISNNSMLLENSYVKGTKENPVKIGQKTVFGHRCQIIGAEIGDFCEIGNGAIFEEGSVVGDYCIFGEDTRVPATGKIPSHSVVVGDPYRIIRGLDEEDKKMISRMRGNQMNLEEEEFFSVKDFSNKGAIKHLIEYRDVCPDIEESTLENLEKEVEIIGQVTIGENCSLSKGVKIIGDSHGSVTLKDNIRVGEDTVIHLLPGNDVVIENGVTIGKNCIIHGCTIDENAVIEDNCNICDNSHVGKNTVVKANSLLPQREILGDNEEVQGHPIK